jgi:uncharacterized protein (TIGR03435 family)
VNAGAAEVTPSFDVASVKPVASMQSNQINGLPIDSHGVDFWRFRGGPGTSNPTRINYSPVTLKMLLARAYNVKDDQISGPRWLDERLYEVVATLPQRTDMETFRLMLQQLLIERFRLNLHRESRVSGVYVLTVAKNGPKLKPAEPPPELGNDGEQMEALRRSEIALLQDLAVKAQAGTLRTNHGFALPRSTVADLTEKLSSVLDHSVKDSTHLEGQYSFELHWADDRFLQRAAAIVSPDTVADTRGPTIFEAVQEQLGFKLQLEKLQSDLIIIDSADPSPTSN